MRFIRKFMFHRIVFLFIAISIQLVVIIGLVLRFNDYFALFYGISIPVSIVIVLRIVNNKSNPAYKIAWIVTVLSFPVFGVLFYVFIGRSSLTRRIKRKMKLIQDKTIDFFSPQHSILDHMESQNITAAHQSRYIQNYAYYPPHSNTSAEYLPVGEIIFERLKEELKNAEHYIFLEYFIIAEGEMWNSILAILVEKVSQGVDVRVIYDAAGCLLTLPYGYYKQLEHLGIKCCVFNPLIPVLSSRLNNRDHRKIAVIDGLIGFTGGINLADEYINRFEKFGHWKDSAIMLKGDAVWNLTVIFLSMWSYLRGIDEDFGHLKNNMYIDHRKFTDGYIQPFADNPLDNEPVGEIVYLNLINKAKKYVYITTPYLIIGNEIIMALSSAAKGGVDVRIITPYIADKWYVHAVTRSYYKILIESGVKIYEYLPGFIHSKTFVVDDEYGVVGTINMDYRSLYLHFECGVWMYNNSSIIDMKNDFINTLKKCRQIVIEDINRIKWYKGLVGQVLRIFAPLM